MPDGVVLDNIDFSIEAIIKAIHRVKPKTTAGPDGFPPLLVRKLGQCLAFPLSLIFKSFMSIGRIPAVWKNATITPVFKG